MACKMVRSFIRAVSLGGALLFALPAMAEEPVETAIRGWISAIDASHQWVAGYDSLAYDAATKKATIKNLAIRSQTLKTKIEIAFGTVDITGYGQTPDGGISALALHASDSRLIVGAIADLRTKAIDIQNLALPSFSDMSVDPEKIFTTVAKGYGIVAKTVIGSLRIEDIESDLTFQNQSTHTSYGTYELTNMAGGMVERTTLGPFKEVSPSPDGLVTMTADKIEMRKFNMNALADVIDPTRYQGGIGDRAWRSVIGLENYVNVAIDVPGAGLRVARVELENLKLRQPERSFAPLFDAVLSDPNLSDGAIEGLLADYMPLLFYAVGWDAFTLSDLDVQAPDVTRFHLGDIHVNGYSSDGIGEIGAGDLDVAGDHTAIGAERLAIGGIGFPSIEAISAAIKADRSGIQSDPLALAPTLGFAEAINANIIQDNQLLGAVDRARLDLSAYVGPVPTSITVDIRNLVLAPAQIPNARIRELSTELGYQQLQADYGFHLAWREVDQSLTLSDFRLKLKDFGSISAGATLTGLTRAMLENPRHLASALPSLLFERGNAVVTDGSITDRLITQQAKKKNQTPEKFRQDLTAAMPLTLMLLLKNPGFQAKLAPAIQAFLTAPGTMTLTAQPPSPVPLSAIIDASKSDPHKLPDLLAIDVKTSTPSQK